VVKIERRNFNDAYDHQQRTRLLFRQRAATLGFTLVNRETGEILEANFLSLGGSFLGASPIAHRSAHFWPSQSRKAVNADPILVLLVLKEALRTLPGRPVRKLRTASFE
jgi:hypothetical protein